MSIRKKNTEKKLGLECRIANNHFEMFILLFQQKNLGAEIPESPPWGLPRPSLAPRCAIRSFVKASHKIVVNVHTVSILCVKSVY